MRLDIDSLVAGYALGTINARSAQRQREQIATGRAHYRVAEHLSQENMRTGRIRTEYSLTDQERAMLELPCAARCIQCR